MEYVTGVDESCCVYGRGWNVILLRTRVVWRSHDIRMNELCHTNKLYMVCKHVYVHTHINTCICVFAADLGCMGESRHTYE